MQKGRIYRVGTCWLLQYRKPVIENGVEKSKRITTKLATYGEEYRTKSDVQPLADAILRPLNAGIVVAESVQTITDYFEKTFMPYVELEASKPRGDFRPATASGYKWMWSALKPYAPNIPLAEFRTMHAQQWLQKVALAKQRSHAANANFKNFLRSAMRYAKRMGLISFDTNPVKDAAIPRGTPRKRREAYTLDETLAMLEVVPEECRTAVAIAALLGLRRGEVQALKWSDFDFAKNEVMVQRSAWQSEVRDTKTVASHAAVPLCEPLIPFLDAHRQRNVTNEWLFHTQRGTPMRLSELYKNKMREPLQKAGIRWRGWHSFRAGTATMLHTLGVDVKLIQQILRHSTSAVTLDFYIKPPEADRQAAMAKLGSAWNKARAERKTA
jgi:integrase